MLFDPKLAARKNALFQAAAHGTGSDVAMLLSLSFAVGDENESDEDESDEGDIRTYDVNETDSEGNSPLLLACRSGNLEIAKILVVANKRGDTPLPATVRAGKVELAKTLVCCFEADVNVINGDGASALHLVNAADNAGSLEMFETLLKYGADVNVLLCEAPVGGLRRPKQYFCWLKDGLSPRELLGLVCALTASTATERPMIDLLQDPKPLAPLTVTDVVKQLVLQESDSVLDNTDPKCTASVERGVVWVNKPPVQQACRWTIQAGGAKSVVYSVDGSRLVRAEGNDVVVCDAVS